MNIFDAIGGVKATWGAVNAAIEMRDTVNLNEVKVAMGNQLMEVQVAAFALMDAAAKLKARCSEIEEEIVQLKKLADIKSQYHLVEPYPGVFLYLINKEYVVAQPAHYICPSCMDNRSMKSIIQFSNKAKTVGSCPECSRIYRLTGAQVRKPRKARASI